MLTKIEDLRKLAVLTQEVKELRASIGLNYDDIFILQKLIAKNKVLSISYLVWLTTAADLTDKALYRKLRDSRRRTLQKLIHRGLAVSPKRGYYCISSELHDSYAARSFIQIMEG